MFKHAVKKLRGGSDTYTRCHSLFLRLFTAHDESNVLWQKGAHSAASSHSPGLLPGCRQQRALGLGAHSTRPETFCFQFYAELDKGTGEVALPSIFFC